MMSCSACFRVLQLSANAADVNPNFFVATLVIVWTFHFVTRQYLA